MIIDLFAVTADINLNEERKNDETLLLKFTFFHAHMIFFISNVGTFVLENYYSQLHIY